MTHDELKMKNNWSKILSSYFESHIKQRFLLVNYFIIIYSFLVIAAYFAHKICPNSGMQGKALLLLAVVMSCIALLFYCFEKKVRFLIYRCQNKLSTFEYKISLDNDLKLFGTEKEETTKEKQSVKLFWIIPISYLFSYSRCINLLIVISWLAYLALLSFIYYSNSGTIPSGCQR